MKALEFEHITNWDVSQTVSRTIDTNESSFDIIDIRIRIVLKKTIRHGNKHENLRTIVSKTGKK